jgi:N-acetyl-beta-hexosaminidase
MKDQDINPKDSGTHIPYRTLLHKLTGTSIQKPRLKLATNVWRKTQRQEIDAEVKKLGTIAWSSLAATRDKVARDMFDRLPAEEQAGWAEQAKEDHEAAVTQWKEENEGKCSTC